jgi:hypothetical protein
MKHRKMPLPLTFFLMLLLLQLPLALGNSLSWLLTVKLHETVGYLVLLLFESAGLLLLFLALGMSFGAVYERRYGQAFGFIALATLSTILGTVLSLILQALLFKVIPVTGRITVTLQLALTPPKSVAVAVMVAVPGATGVTFPFASTVATAVLEDFHVKVLFIAFSGDMVAVS